MLYVLHRFSPQTNRESDRPGREFPEHERERGEWQGREWGSPSSVALHLSRKYV